MVNKNRNTLEKGWVIIDGTLEPIDYQGDSSFRFPGELAELVIKKFTKKGDWILDPFTGFGTTLHVAQQMQRNAIGFETDKSRADFAARGLMKPNRVINDNIEKIDLYSLPEFDLLFTSPPYYTVDEEKDPLGKAYFADIERIFIKIKPVLKPGAAIVVEASNIRDENEVITLAWRLGELLARIYRFQGEMIRCNTGDTEAGPGYCHSYLLVYENNY